MTTEQQATWIYGVVPAGSSLEEVDRRSDRLPSEVWVVESGDLAAIVGDKPQDDAQATRDQALAHARVLEAAILDAPVIPFRFGTIVQGGEEEVGSELLEARHDELSQLLKRFEDHVQMTVKVSYHEDAVLREIVEGNEEIAQLREQSRQGAEEATRDVRVRLGELVNAALDQLREQDSAEVIEELKSVSVAAATEELESEFMVLNAPFLVERDRMQEFEDAVERVAQPRQERMQFTLIGPMPVYNFIDAEEPAWA